jgi:hypothetical protein
MVGVVRADAAATHGTPGLHTVTSASRAALPCMTVDMLRAWSERICTMKQGGREVVAMVLGQPLAGTMQIHDDRVVIDLASPITLSELTDAFGPGHQMTRDRADAPHRVALYVMPPNTPASCDVIATLDGEPSSNARAVSIVLRRNHLWPERVCSAV